MALINRSFDGKLNLDTSENRVPPQDYVEALNITRDSQDGAQDLVVTNINGNRKVNFNLPAGTNKRIGSKDDPKRNRIYYFIWNSNGNNLWLYYDRTTDSIVKLIEDLTDTNNEPVLAFNPSKRINHIDIFYRDQEGDLVLWTDGNTTPKCANVQSILDGTYSTIKSAFIELAKMPPLSPATAEYGNDTTKTGNALRRKLFQFSYRWDYVDFQKSTFAPYSKVPLPVGIYGSDNDLDNSNNNFITVTLNTGDENVTDIEIAVRSNIGDAWGDFVLVASLNKEQLGIPNNSTYQFLFYNDALYPPLTDGVQYVNGVQVISLFDWCPQLCDCLVLANGNVPVPSAITEGYDPFPINDLQVTMTVENIKNIPPDTDPPQMTYTQLGNTFTFTVSGSIPTGTLFKVIPLANIPPPTSIVLAQYTSLPGDTVAIVCQQMYNYILANYSTYAQGFTTTTFFANLPMGSSILQTIVQTSGSGGSSIATEKTWLWSAQYIFGLVYSDEQGRDMPGVITYSNPTDTDNDFVVNTPDFSEDSGTPETPVISASINHLPPAGANKFHWVRRRQTYGSFLFYMTCDYQDPGDGYLYFCLANIAAFKSQNSQFIYGAAPVFPESRIKIIAGVGGGVYDGNIYGQDYQIIGQVDRTLTSGSSPDDAKPFIKVTKPIGVISPAYQFNMMVMVYTPAANPTSLAESVYWEFGEDYDIYEDNGVMYHRGGDQDQTASQPATFTFQEGDVYYRQRPMYENIVGDPPYDSQQVEIMDANYSDYFDSAINDNGRAHAIEVNAGRRFNGVLTRFAQAYQANTNLNGFNTFYYENFDEYDARFGNIAKTFIDKRYLFVFQQFDIGIVPVLTQIIKDTAGNPLEANSDILLNKIMYPYEGQFGIGNVPESFAFGKGAKYFIDNNKGVVCRLSNDGVTVLSVTYECNNFFISKLAAYKTDLNNGNPPSGGVYTGNPTVYGVFDSYTNKYIISLEEINRYNAQGYLSFHQDPETICFLETRDAKEGFESKHSYHSEGMSCLNNLTVSFKNGELWKHDSPVYCNFYGTQYPAYITAVFNDNLLEKKSWQAVSQIADTIWVCPLIYTNTKSYGTQRQESELIEQDFALLEDMPSAGIRRDIWSIGGVNNGDQLKGNYMVVRFQKTNASSLVTLTGVAVKIIDSPLTAQ